MYSVSQIVPFIVKNVKKYLFCVEYFHVQARQSFLTQILIYLPIYSGFSECRVVMAAAGQKSRRPEKRPSLPGIRLFLKLASQYEQPSSLKFNVPAILIVSFRVQKSSWATSALITCQLSFLQKQLSSF